MKNILSLSTLSICILLLSACGSTVSSKDEQDFKTSKAKMEEKLDKADQENLEKALKVIL